MGWNLALVVFSKKNVENNHIKILKNWKIHTNINAYYESISTNCLQDVQTTFNVSEHH